VRTIKIVWKIKKGGKVTVTSLLLRIIPLIIMALLCLGIVFMLYGSKESRVAKKCESDISYRVDRALEAYKKIYESGGGKILQPKERQIKYLELREEYFTQCLKESGIEEKK
jgi:hypothetical protein